MRGMALKFCVTWIWWRRGTSITSYCSPKKPSPENWSGFGFFVVVLVGFVVVGFFCFGFFLGGGAGWAGKLMKRLCSLHQCFTAVVWRFSKPKLEPLTDRGRTKGSTSSKFAFKNYVRCLPGSQNAPAETGPSRSACPGGVPSPRRYSSGA